MSRQADKFNCHKCPHHYCDAEGKMPGSRGRAPFAVWVINKEEYRTCPLPMVTEFSRETLRLHVHYRNRLLLVGGGVMDQPASYLQAMEIIEAAFATAQGDTNGQD